MRWPFVDTELDNVNVAAGWFTPILTILACYYVGDSAVGALFGTLGSFFQQLPGQIVGFIQGLPGQVGQMFSDMMTNAGYIVGYVDEDAILGPSRVQKGNVLIGLPSSGTTSPTMRAFRDLNRVGRS